MDALNLLLGKSGGADDSRQPVADCIFQQRGEGRRMGKVNDDIARLGTLVCTCIDRIVTGRRVRVDARADAGNRCAVRPLG